MPNFTTIGTLLSGIDPAYDEAIIAGVEAMNDDSGKPLPFDRKIFSELRKENERPLSAAYFLKKNRCAIRR